MPRIANSSPLAWRALDKTALQTPRYKYVARPGPSPKSYCACRMPTKNVDVGKRGPRWNQRIMHETE